MGGNNIIDILKDDYDKFIKLETLVLQPNNNAYQLRKFLTENGFSIVNEKLVKENNVIYEIIKASHGQQCLDYKQLYFGPILLKDKNSLFIEKYKQYLSYLKSLLIKIPINLKEKRKLIIDEIKLLEDELNYEI